MIGKDSELKVVRQSRDGRRRYDEGGKRVLIEAALRPGASVARLAQEHGINANLLRKWIAKYLMEREKGIPFASQETRADERDLPSSAIDAIAHEDFRRCVDDGSTDVAGSRKHFLCAPSTSAFVPVVSTSSVPPLPLVLTATAPITLSLHVRLSNGVELDLSAASIDELSTVVQMFGEDAVFRFDENLKVYLYRDPVDFRYGMNSLSILVEQAMRLNPMDSSLYVFTNRRCDRVKILGWQDNGFWLMLKRLEANDRFVWPDDNSEVVALTVELLHWLLGGADIAALQRHPRRHYARVS